MAKELVERGVSIHVRNFTDGTPLRSAADSGHAELVRWFLDQGADPSVVDRFEKRAVDYAREQRHHEVVEILKNALPRPGADDPMKRQPLTFALPERMDATLQMARQCRDEETSMTACATSALEAPTVLAVARPWIGDVNFSVEDKPDPRRR